MSAWSEWKAGLLTDAEYNTICRKEAYEDDCEEYREPCEWDLFDDDELFEEDVIDDFD